MSKEKIYIFDTTLRDGAQTEGVDFSIEDKNKIAKVLSDIGVDYVEGGWPGANPVDTKFFSSPPKMQQTLFTAFGMTKKTGRSADNDPGLASLMNANTPAVCVVGKSWDFHVKVALGIQKEENLENIKETAKHFVKNNKEFLFDAEHFFDGYKANPEYAIDCLKQAYDNGARWVVLCDTNGGTLPNEVREIVSKVSKIIPGNNLGIHAHNDTENAVANSLAAVESGVRHIQGTINGLGERCGNANLMSIIPNLCLKKSFSDKYEINIKKDKLSSLTECSRLLDEILNRKPNKNMAYVGASAFSHIEGTKIDDNVVVGPYARLRPGTILKSHVKIGNFVETKKSIISNKSKVNHLSYIGDTFVGKNSNIGAGTITCNYDGIRKSKTKILDNVFVGSNTSLVAPVKLESKSVVGAGSVITKNVKSKSLALTRTEQKEVKDYIRKKKNKCVELLE